jgi:hypothetical protein
VAVSGEVGCIEPWTYPYDGHCLMCRWGYPVLFGKDDPVETWVCGMHTVYGLRSKKLTAPPIDRSRYELGRGYAPLMMWDDACDRFERVERGSRKWRYLARYEIVERAGGAR